jgi:hypothetical protein
MGLTLSPLPLLPTRETTWPPFPVGLVAGSRAVLVLPFGTGFGRSGGSRPREEIAAGSFGAFGGFITCFFPPNLFIRLARVRSVATYASH